MTAFWASVMLRRFWVVGVKVGVKLEGMIELTGIRR